MTLERQPWPFPGDTALDRARRIAQSYRAELVAADPAAAALLDARAIQFGEGWVTGETLATVDLDDVLPAPAMAEVVGEEPATIRQWAARGHIRKRKDAKQRTVYRVGDVLDYQAQQRLKRARRRTGQQEAW